MDCDIPAAASAFRKHLQWRKDQGVDVIRQEIVDRSLGLSWGDYPRGAEVEKYFPQVLDGGRGREGHIIQVECMSLVQTDGLLGDGSDGSVGQAAFLRAFIFALEARNKLMDDLSRQTGRMIRVIQIRDLTGFWPSSRAITFGKMMAQLSQDNCALSPLLSAHSAGCSSHLWCLTPSGPDTHHINNIKIC